MKRPQTATEFERMAKEVEAKYRRPMAIQIAEAQAFLREAVKHPDWKFLDVNLPEDDFAILLLESGIRGALSGHLQIRAMLRSTLHPNSRERNRAKRQMALMNEDKLPYHRDQLQ